MIVCCGVPHLCSMCWETTISRLNRLLQAATLDVHCLQRGNQRPMPSATDRRMRCVRRFDGRDMDYHPPIVDIRKSS